MSYSYMPTVENPPRNQDAWIVLIVSVIITTITTLPALYLANKLKGINFVKGNEIIIGKLPTKIVTLIITIYYSYVLLTLMLYIIIFISSSIFPETPSWGILLFIAIPVVYAALKGAGALARMAFIIVPYMLLNVIVFFILGFNKMDFNALLPVLKDSTLREIGMGATLHGLVFVEILLIPFLSEYIEKNFSVYKTMWVSLAIYLVIGLMMVISVITVLGIGIAQSALNPYYFFTRQVEVYDFVQRVESLNVLGWFTGALLRLALYTFMIGKMLSDTFKTKSYKPFVVIIVSILSLIVLMPFINKISAFQTLINLSRYDPIILLSIPIIILSVYFIRRKKVDKKIEELRQVSNIQN